MKSGDTQTLENYQLLSMILWVAMVTRMLVRQNKATATANIFIGEGLKNA